MARATPPTGGLLDPEEGLLERDPELALLAEDVAAARAGSGGLRLIEGPAGIGKSALLAAAARIAARQNEGTQPRMRCLSARVTEIEHEIPFGAIRQLLEGHLRDLPAAERRDLFSGSAAPAETVLSLRPADEAGERVSSSAEERRETASPPVGPPAAPDVPDMPAAPDVLYGLHWLIANLAERQPLLLLLDDAHWADPDSIRFLAFAAPRLAQLPVLLVVAARPQAPVTAPPRVAEHQAPGQTSSGLLAQLAATASDPAAQPITPPPLGVQACATIVAEAFSAPPSPELIEACHQVSGGNPFYLHALLDELARERIEPDEVTRERILSLSPRTVTRTILARISEIEPAAIRVARAAAVLGEDSSQDLVARLAGVEPVRAAALVDQLTVAAVFEAGERVAFSHPIVRTAIYSDIARAERAEMHRRAAALFADDGRGSGAAIERAAAHLLATDPAGAPTTVELLRRAAAGAIGRGAPETAAGFLRRALREPPRPGDEQAQLLLELGSAELATDGRAAHDHLLEALNGVGPPSPRRFAIVHALAAAHLSIGDTERLSELLQDEIELAAAAEASEQAMALTADLVIAQITSPDGEQMREAHRRIEQLAPQLTGGSPADRALLACLAYSRLCRGLPVDQVARPALEYLATKPGGGSPAGPEWIMAAGVLVRCGELDRAERAAREEVAAARESGSAYALSGAYWMLGVAAQTRGRLAEAAAHLEAALRGARDFGASAGIHASLAALIVVEMERGETGAAEEALIAEGLESGAIAALVTPGELLESRAQLRLAQGDAAAALDDFERMAQIARERGDLGPGMTLWRGRAALAHLRLGDQGLARQLAVEELERARRFGESRTLGVALTVAGMAETGGRQAELLGQAVEQLRDSPFRLDLARALVETGAALRRGGERAAARQPLREGLGLARACGAAPLAERAFEELRATGAKPRKVLRTGVDALTPSEARVARLAAAGMSNREIAQQLFISPRTVEFHLRQVFVKLAVRSRTELGDALARE